MIAETRISRLLAGYRDRPAADIDALADVLVRVSDLIIHHPEIRELDINPLLVDENGVIAIDARMKLADEEASPRTPLAIRPYPAHLQRPSASMASARLYCVRSAPTTSRAMYPSLLPSHRTISACASSRPGVRSRTRSWPV